MYRSTMAGQTSKAVQVVLLASRMLGQALVPVLLPTPRPLPTLLHAIVLYAVNTTLGNPVAHVAIEHSFPNIHLGPSSAQVART